MNIDVTCICLLTLYVGQKLCIVFFFFSKANFLTTLRSYLDVICFYYFWSNLLKINVNYDYIYMVYCSCFIKSIDKNIVNYI